MHLIYLIHEFHNLSWITEINELFHNKFQIYWDAPVCLLERMLSQMEILVMWKVPLKVCQLGLPFNSNLHRHLQSWSWTNKVRFTSSLILYLPFLMHTSLLKPSIGTSFFIYVHLFVQHKCLFFLDFGIDGQCFMIWFFVFSICNIFPIVFVLLCFVTFHLVVQSRGQPELRSSVSWSSTTETHATLPIKALSFLLTDSLKLTDKQVKTEIKMCQEMDHASYAVHFHAHHQY